MAHIPEKDIPSFLVPKEQLNFNIHKNKNNMENLTDLLKGKVIKNVTHNDAGQVTGIEFEVEKFVPKDGDFIAWSNGGVGIFNSIIDKEWGFYHAVCFFNPMYLCTTKTERCDLKGIKPATDSERQILLDALAKDGKRWNADKKCVEKLRWRADVGEQYISFTIGATGRINARVRIDYRSNGDDILFSAGNYFSPITDTEPILKRINVIFAENL